MSNNLRLYELARNVPEEAKKAITAGRLKGMTDINPMFRIKRLTEIFGPCGVGWWYDITDKHLAADEQTKQVAAFVDILLYYKDPETGEPSHGIPGTGGASFVAQERNGPYMSDECYKMALTDAISVAAKALGIGADVYWDKDRTKYSAPATENQPKPSPAVIFCENCGTEIVPYVSPKNGGTVTPDKHAAGSIAQFEKVLCLSCIEREKKIRQLESIGKELQGDAS